MWSRDVGLLAVLTILFTFYLQLLLYLNKIKGWSLRVGDGQNPPEDLT
jgi:hypothetical protein